MNTSATPDGEDLALAKLVASHPRLFVLTGAGCSTASGLGDYRDRDGAWKRAQPMTGQVFRADIAARRRYWARSAIGWPLFSRARPNAAHRALASLESLGQVHQLVTQNVDRLHQTAGHRGVIDLHGVLATVGCLDCGRKIPREQFQLELLARNAWLERLTAAGAPDGDADFEHPDVDSLCVPACERCGGMLKPDVVFFGENVPRPRVEFAMRQLRAADALLVAGSSLMVYSGYRFCRDAASRRQPIVILNDGRTRADDLATLKLGGDVGQRLTRLVELRRTVFDAPSAANLATRVTAMAKPGSSVPASDPSIDSPVSAAGERLPARGAT